ncbi:MAG: hypothetical protein KKB62_01780, partial [Nanoarchaeota archaeon]|nr:hypothetical protein [Nanoarchaeota archaeon]
MKHRKSGVISKIVPTLLLSSALAFGQVKDKPVVQKPSLEEKIIFDIGSVAQNVIGGYNDYYQIKDRRLFAKGDPNYKKYSELWHYSTALNIGAAISLGAFSGYKNEDNWEEYLKDGLTYSAIRWVVKDGVYNSLNGDPF